MVPRLVACVARAAEMRARLVVHACPGQQRSNGL